MYLKKRFAALSKTGVWIIQILTRAAVWPRSALTRSSEEVTCTRSYLNFSPHRSSCRPAVLSGRRFPFLQRLDHNPDALITRNQSLLRFDDYLEGVQNSGNYAFFMRSQPVSE
jgi:hypothetical protein